jgi:TolB-like protein
VLFATWLIATHRGNKLDAAKGWPTDFTQLRLGNGMPTLMVQDFEAIGTPSPQASSARGLQEKLRDVFARFDAINIATKAPPSNATIDYRLQGFIEYLEDGTTRVRVRLFDVIDSNVVWTSTFFQQTRASDRKTSEDSIAIGIASTLLQPFGIIQSRERTKYISGSVGDPRYRCLLLASDAFRSYDPGEQAQARSCLEQLISLDQSFGDGYSYLAVLYQRERIYRIGPAANDPAALDVALRLAQRGVELKPDSARAWHILGVVFFARKDNAAGVTALQKAMALNPYDLLIPSSLGGRLISIGEIDRGMNILRSIPDYGGPRPSFDRFSFFLGYYMRDEMADAAREADEMTGDSFTFGLFARALMAASKGNSELAKSYWSKLVALRTDWRDDPRGELERFIPSPAILDRLIHDLRSAGLIENK